MKPDEWQRAMDHEAASVEDVRWARDTRKQARSLPARRQVLPLLLASALSVTITALVTLGSQWAVLVREAARNNVEIQTFLKWNALGNPVPVTTHAYSSDPDMPFALLLLFVFLLAALAARSRLSPWVVLLATTCGVLTLTSLTALLPTGLQGFPALPLLLTLGVAALGVLLGQPFQPGASRT